MIITIVFMPIISLGNFVAPKKKKNSSTEKNDNFGITVLLINNNSI